MKPRILIFCDYYLPGHKSGGGMWTVVNLVNTFHTEYEFHIVTRNHDGREDKRPYSDVETGAWNAVGNASVFYATGGMITQRRFHRILEEVKPNLVYLNSVFCTLSVKFLALRRRKKIYHVPVVLAPCGELAPAALGLKPLKKRTFLTAARVTGLFRDVIWKASAEAESNEIRDAIGKNTEILVAPDLPPKEILPTFNVAAKPAKHPGSVSLIFVSRITPKKNLLFLLERLKGLEFGDVSLDIVGPAEDAAYWRECQAVIRQLPQNVRVNNVGPLKYEEVLERLIASHFFVLPTLNENFGYVFVEAMAAGCPLVISDRTIWMGLESKGIGWDLSLDDAAAWMNSLNRCISMDGLRYSAMSAAARDFAVNWLNDPSVKRATADVLNHALKRSRAER
jgi:glycosyltransferase involved in cell wall biosynthesis